MSLAFSNQKESSYCGRFAVIKIIYSLLDHCKRLHFTVSLSSRSLSYFSPCTNEKEWKKSVSHKMSKWNATLFHLIIHENFLNENRWNESEKLRFDDDEFDLRFGKITRKKKLKWNVMNETIKSRNLRMKIIYLKLTKKKEKENNKLE